LRGRLVVTTVGEGGEEEVVDVGDGAVVVEERVEVGDVVDGVEVVLDVVDGVEVVLDVVDGVEVVLEVVLSDTMVDESDVVSGSDAELGGLASLVGRLGDVGVGADAVSSVLVDVDDEGVAESVGSIVVLTAGALSSGTSNGDPVPSQYKLIALGPPHTCDASPLHAMSQ
jgi:hypothetical protein